LVVEQGARRVAVVQLHESLQGLRDARSLFDAGCVSM
jgi:hypothetical protein